MINMTVVCDDFLVYGRSSDRLWFRRRWRRSIDRLRRRGFLLTSDDDLVSVPAASFIVADGNVFALS